MSEIILFLYICVISSIYLIVLEIICNTQKLVFTKLFLIICLNFELSLCYNIITKSQLDRAFYYHRPATACGYYNYAKLGIFLYASCILIYIRAIESKLN